MLAGSPQTRLVLKQSCDGKIRAKATNDQHTITYDVKDSDDLRELEKALGKFLRQLF
ncbi:hypothetical protein GNI_144460 [Gregarina niphandrodes]|uniref:Uncharacterized protein n=1 Tax=Gregarina niphandrodes TaxID=110365 RepID=A0A023B0C1_GRENI|nr:hypothetical protein GNI_144460 [Gregarina niphandrodes]EZG44710.1 hypothetical protein GNI_144460 [Gregarina niphandrodes]|eukprot:XP_011134130.1 hypothetical protein GNI_144460 [Gregarina niphandrodes]